MSSFIKINCILLVFCLFSVNAALCQEVSLDTTKSFFPNLKKTETGLVSWNYLSVPENWENRESKQISVAVTVLKSKSNEKNAGAVLFVQGGPGASGVQNIGPWLNHPLRSENDIVLFDVRGTGFSKPRLCPDLGKEFLKILSKNQSRNVDRTMRVAAVESCRKNLIERKIDIGAYHSLSVAKDLHVLKSQLGYNKWVIYGVSYGTYMAQIYANTYPKDIQALILDSPINDISTYYTQNTSNYIGSLTKVFESCKSDPECNKEYPNLETIYYEVISDLSKTPLTVQVDREIVESGTFTFNSEDFKVAIQQALYKKELIELIPLMIFQFHNQNVSPLEDLVSAFSSLLNMDYGVYYCISCNEVLPNNLLSDYQKDADIYQRLQGGISFYEADFKICREWNLSGDYSVMTPSQNSRTLSNLSAPVILFAGNYDPITPVSNIEKMNDSLKLGYSVIVTSYGHVPSLNWMGANIAKDFVKNPSKKPDVSAYKMNGEITYIKNIELNQGVSKMGKSLSQLNFIFLSPLVIALGVISFFIVIGLNNLRKRKYAGVQDKTMRLLCVLTSILGVVGFTTLVFGIIRVANQNHYILAFGLPDKLNYIFSIILIFITSLIIAIMYFVIRLKKINNRTVILNVLFSNALLIIYFFYWGII